MLRSDFTREIIITAERGNFLKLVGNDKSEEIIGRPERIIFSNTGIIPEFEEVPIVVDAEAKETTKTTKKSKKK